MENVATQQEMPVEFDIQKERSQIDQLIASWQQEKDNVKVRRELRENKRNVFDERQKKTILDDETIIPDRTINTNIRRGRVPYINYITQSKRLLIFKDEAQPDMSTESIETWFTDGMRYPHWKIPWVRAIDCIQTHGGCAVEVMYDLSKPLNCTIEYIPRNALIFHKDTRDIQANPRLLRLYEITTLQLEEFKVNDGFDPDICDKIRERYRNNTKLISIYRMLFKRDGIVFNCWYSPDENNKWLRAPQPHNIGLFEYPKDVVFQMYNLPGWETIKFQFMNPAKLTKYPIFWLPFDVTENEVILETSGRTALDVQEQEALTQVVTNTVNATTRASRFYPTATLEPGADPKMLELGPLKPGVVGVGMQYFQPPWPNNIILAVAQLLQQRNAQSSGNTDFASLARKDANKTATEMQLATQNTQQLSTTEIMVFSSPFLDVLVLCFNISRDQAIFGMCKPPTHPDLLTHEYFLSPAGDVEVIKRQEDKENAKEFFNIVRGTPLAEKIFAFLLQHYFPDEADAWLQVLNTPDKDKIIQQLVAILQQIPQDELAPEVRASLQAIIISAQNVAGAGNDANVPKGPPPQAGPAISPGNEPQQTVTV